MVTVDVPAEAEADTASERTALDAVAPALKDPITPAGRPEMLTVTESLKPFSEVKDRVLLAVPPCGTLRAVGAADKANVAGKVRVSAMAVLAISAPDVPVMVTVAEAAAAVLAAVKVTVRVWLAVVGPKAAVTPAGNPEAVSATESTKPF